MTDRTKDTPNGDTIGGFLAATVIAAACLAMLSPISGRDELVDMLLTFLVVFPFTVAATLALGVPAFALVNHWNLVRWWSAILGGAVIGALAIVIVSEGNVSGAGMPIYGAAGALAGLSFWVVWRRKHKAGRRHGSDRPAAD
ncbi:hypothetical protein ACNI65_08915 [Roseateles sp. So40a]|uniref:hypothetical protein n=1 Tax=Roseateles sp. So40a TaxID=3400226 RepID=UPI003A8986E4